jgi:hypothetical protein
VRSRKLDPEGRWDLAAKVRSTEPVVEDIEAEVPQERNVYKKISLTHCYLSLF